MKRARIVVLAALAVVVLGGGLWWRSHRHSGVGAATSPDLRAPTGVRVRVAVLNGTKTRGLARRATLLLRDRGFDVVEVGTESAPHDTTMIYDLTGHPDWAHRVARTFTPGRVEARPDSSRYLDVVVVLGATWRPPAEPFYP